MNLNRATLKSTLSAVIGILAVVGPKLLEILGTPTNRWAALAVQGAGAIVLACTTGRAVLWLNKLLPDATRASDGPAVRNVSPIVPLPAENTKAQS
jgi:hypothetical protein